MRALPIRNRVAAQGYNDAVEQSLIGLGLGLEGATRPAQPVRQ